ncbi:MAG: DUF4292 domain-containing protein, partial [Muribaculaceae bacterium]|nr:DUF4292 domain-containing protein [Muribaculaceae bacterium]
IVCLVCAFSFLGACASKKKVVANDTVINSSPAALTSRSLVADALGLYTDWTTAQVNGKIKMKSLPVNPSLRIYMKRGEEIVISASAILVGEVFRLELDRDSIFVVNKMKKVYCKESAEKLIDAYPTICEEIQSVLLGRVVVPGAGVLSEKNLDKVAVSIEKDMRKISPDMKDLPVGIFINYLLGNDGRVVKAEVLSESKRSVCDLGYDWDGDGGVDIDVNIYQKNNPISVLISLDKPKWGATPMQPFKLGKGYQRVGIKEFFSKL